MSGDGAVNLGTSADRSVPARPLSVVIPAHDEEAVVGRCLDSLLADPVDPPLDIVVVANGCSDRTAEVARSRGVRVVETAVASKPAALDLGDQAASGFPRLYVDADVVVDAAASVACGAALSDGSADLAAPRLDVDVEDRPWLVRAFYAIWTELPWVTESLVGSGFYGLSAQARARFERFPDTMAEDLFIRSLVPASRRRIVAEHRFVVQSPRTTGALVRVLARRYAANARDHALFASEADAVRSGHLSELARMARRPGRWPRLAGYSTVVLVAKVRARSINRSDGPATWLRDTSSRDAAELEAS